MRTLRNAWRRLLFLVSRDRHQAELDEEMQFHLACKEQEARDAGLDPARARQAAIRAFGNTTSLRETGLEMWGWGWLDRLSQDVRWSVRTLRRNPAFTVTAALTLALGIGVNVAIFSFVRAQLLRPLPYPHPDRLVWIFEATRTFLDGQPIDATDATVAAWKGARSLEAMGLFAGTRLVLTGMGEAEDLAIGAVSPSLLTMLGGRAWRGRLFTEEENQRGRDAVAVLSHGFWLRRFGGRDEALGRDLVLGDRTYTIVGVLPPGFGFGPLDRPDLSWNQAKDTSVWIPVSTQSDPRQLTSRFYLGVLGRLAPRVTATAAQDELSRLAAAVNAGRSSVVVGLQQELVKGVRRPLLLLSAAAGFILLIVCANVAHLQLARGMARAREMAIRTAIGAGRRRLVRQLLVESTLLAAAGGLLALVAVKLSLGTLLWLAGRDLPAGPVALDGAVFAFTVASALAAAVLFGLFPARQAAALDPQVSLKEGGRGPTRHVRRTTGLLVVAEIALALVLVACAGLMVNTLWRLQHVPLGFRTDNIVTVGLRLPPALTRDNVRTTAFFDRLHTRLRALPGIEAVEFANTLPMGGAATFNGFQIVGAPPLPPGTPGPTSQYRVVSPGYFRLLGIPLRRGRGFTDADGATAPRVAIVNETMERRFFGGHAVGRRIIQGQSEPVEIIGVVGDIRHETQRSDPMPEVYHPLGQRQPWRPWLAVGTGRSVESVATDIRAALADVEPRAAITEVRSMSERRQDSLGTSRLLIWVLAAFAALALLLALIGGYGVVSYWVSRRKQEFGVRLALGAPASRLVALVLRETLGLVAAALVIGVAGAAACSRLLANYLYEVEPTDPTTFAAAVGLVLLTSAVAAYLPARRAAATDPLVALRQD